MQLGRAPLVPGLLTGPLENLSQVHLVGSYCAACGETALGKVDICPNCGGASISEVVLSESGILYSFTVVRHRPPGNFYQRDAFQPFGLGLIELEQGVRVMAPIKGDPEGLRIGQRLVFAPFVMRTAEDGTEIVGFAYEPEA